MIRKSVPVIAAMCLSGSLQAAVVVFSEGEGDPLGRPEGAPLWPERFDRDALLKQKAAMPTADWSALFQQSPVPEGYCNVVVTQIEPPVRPQLWLMAESVNCVKRTSTTVYAAMRTFEVTLRDP